MMLVVHYFGANKWYSKRVNRGEKEHRVKDTQYLDIMLYIMVRSQKIVMSGHYRPACVCRKVCGNPHLIGLRDSAVLLVQ